MSFIRPEVAESVRKWREVLIGIGLLGLAAILMQDAYGGRFWIGILVTALGLGLVFTGVPRARARTAGGAAGVIEVDERRITYFGPVSGGAMAQEDIRRIAADPGRRWVLSSVSGELMTIPMDAEGREALFDAFTALPGLSASRLAEAIQQDVSRRTVIWERSQSRSS